MDLGWKASEGIRRPSMTARSRAVADETVMICGVIEPNHKEPAPIDLPVVREQLEEGVACLGDAVVLLVGAAGVGMR
jgi:hypothetical protein